MQSIFSTPEKSSRRGTFRLVAHIKSPAIIHGELTLESLLAACVHDESGEIRDEALAKVPIDQLSTPDGPIWLASSVMFSGVAKTQKESVIRGRHFSEMGPDFYEPNPRSRIDGWAVDQQRGDNMRIVNTYTSVQVQSLVWYAQGDMEEACRLLSTQICIGKRRGSGFGEVAQVTASRMTCNPLVDNEGKVRRPVALRKLQHLQRAAPIEQQRVINAAENHPAWLQERELCAMPPTQMEHDEFDQVIF